MYRPLFFILGIGALVFGIMLFLTIDREPEPTSLVTQTETRTAAAITVPRHLERAFRDTDWSKADPSLEQALSGGPGKDGIPALDNPTFIPLNEFEGSNDLQAIVLKDDDTFKAYPYNILTWHEIVNDTVGGTPVAITFCPLCGSAIVFNRTLSDGAITTFGVSGSLLESNMIMFDRTTESLWQQSTGKTLAGTLHESQLTLEPFQLLTLGELRQNFPEALIMSEDTGYRRDYRRNPYAGYETDNRFIFEPSNIDRTFNPKEIMVVFLIDDTTPVATPWNQLLETRTVSTDINDTTYILTLNESNELSISNEAGTTFPFYYEMWFSLAAQHGDMVETITIE